SAVELRLGEKSRSLPKNLIRSPELTILTLEPLDPLKLRRPRARPLALIPLRLPHPAPQRVTRATDLLRNRLDRRPLRRVFPLGVQHQPNRPLPDLSGVPLCLVHDPNPSKIAASGKPRAVHFPGRARVRVRVRECVRRARGCEAPAVRRNGRNGRRGWEFAPRSRAVSRPRTRPGPGAGSAPP